MLVFDTLGMSLWKVVDGRFQAPSTDVRAVHEVHFISAVYNYKCVLRDGDDPRRHEELDPTPKMGGYRDCRSRNG